MENGHKYKEYHGVRPKSAATDRKVPVMKCEFCGVFESDVGNYLESPYCEKRKLLEKKADNA